MWSYVGRKSNPRWLWHAIDRQSGAVLAYVFGRRKDQVFLQLQKLLLPFGIKRYCTDGWGAYERHLPAECHEIGKRKTQRIERKHLKLRTRIKRLARRTICFSLDRRNARFSTYIVDHDESKLEQLALEVLKLWEKQTPAQTLVPVPKLALRGMLFEVDAVAVIPANNV